MGKKALSGYAGLFAAVIALAATSFCFPATAQLTQIAGTKQLNGHVPRAISRFHLHPLQNLPSTNLISLALTLPLRNQQGLDGLLQQIYDPASPEFHHYLTSQQFDAQFGPSQQDYDTVVNFLKTNGFSVTTHSDRTLVDASGNTAAINHAFHLTLRMYQHPTESRKFYAPDTDPVISSGIPISHITGLDNFVIPGPMAKVMHRSATAPGVRSANYTGSGPNGEFMGQDFRAAYAPGVTLNGAGQTVALFELDGYYLSDITNYELAASLPSTTLTNISVNGGVTSITEDGDGEVSLDIEMAISMATNLSRVIVYEAPNGGNNSVLDLLQRIATDNLAKQISSSWLIGDSSSYETYYQRMAAQGQSFFQASGDNGAYYSGISEWADDTNITLVGGTTLSTSGPGGSWTSETVWNWYSQGIGTGVGGGGTNFNGVPIPAYQQGINMTNNQGSSTLRNVPDVALTADDIYVYYNQGNFNSGEYFGGTSAAAPLWAAFTALVNQQAVAQGESTVGFINPAVYAIGKSANYANDFHDITTGNNTNTTVGNEWYATNGYDLCTGWGTPNGQNLINALAPPAQLPFSLAPSTGFNAVGSTGGPFTPSSQVYVLTNSTASPVQWALTNNASWLSVSATNGTLPPDSATNVTISINAVANNLAAGTYNGAVTFTNSATVTLNSLAFTLQVSEPLVITPSAGFTANLAVEGGPVAAASQTFYLTNTGSTSLTWQGSASTWLNLSPSGGTLAGGSGQAATVTLNANAANFTTGTYNGQASFTDENSGVVQQRQFTLSIGQNLVQNGGFETGDFTDWNLNGSASHGLTIYNGVVSVVTVGSVATNFIHSGNDGAALGHKGFSFLYQSLATVPGQSYLFSLWLNDPQGDTPNQFFVDWNTNASGTNTIFNQSNFDTAGLWTNLLFVVPATGTNTTIVFASDNSNYYFGLDDVNVWPLPTPNIRGFSKISNQTLSLTWNTLTNVAYEVESSTNLASPNWLILSTNTAFGPTLTVTNSIGANPATFYRVLRLP
jgi:Pro-kumamolisin, activation domain/Viral BACON domain